MMFSEPSIRLSAWKVQACEIFTRDAWDAGADPGPLLPSVLFSYAGRKVWHRQFPRMRMRNYVLDSGAFSAHGAGEKIEREHFYDDILRFRAEGFSPIEIFTLDVIGNAAASQVNTEWFWAHGIQVIPVYHFGEPEDLLLGYARDYPKVALGGAVGLPRKLKERWARHCFARLWPKPIHGLGFGIWALEVLPFHSIDSADWEAGCSRYGRWESLGGRNPGLKKQNIYDNMGLEAQHWLTAERRARQRWRSTFRELAWDETAFLPFPDREHT